MQSSLRRSPYFDMGLLHTDAVLLQKGCWNYHRSGLTQIYRLIIDLSIVTSLHFPYNSKKLKVGMKKLLGYQRTFGNGVCMLKQVGRELVAINIMRRNNLKCCKATILAILLRWSILSPVTRGRRVKLLFKILRPPGKMCWAQVKTIGHSFGTLWENSSPPLVSQSSCGPVFALSWLFQVVNECAFNSKKLCRLKLQGCQTTWCIYVTVV